MCRFFKEVYITLSTVCDAARDAHYIQMTYAEYELY